MVRKLPFILLALILSACAGAPAATPTATPAPPTETSLPSHTPTITSTPLPTHTPTPDVVMLTFTKNAFCRSGPGTLYFDIGSFNQGDTAQATGRNDTDPRWWYVLKPDGGACWVSEATVESNEAAASLPVRQAELLLPQTPPDLWVDRVCKPNKGGFAVTLNWTPSGTADGYYVYVNGELRQNIKNELQKSYVIKLPMNETVTYSFEAYNSIGAGERVTFEDHCP